MGNSACVVKVNGNDYYCPCDRVDDLAFIDDYIVNLSSQSITLFSSFIEPNDRYTGYPRIQVNGLTKAIYRDSYNSSTSSAMYVSSFEVVHRNFTYSFILFIVILGVLICQLFKR